MAGSQAVTFQRVPLVQICKLVRCCVVAKQTTTTFFFISCVKCLWDFVGRFLGLQQQSRNPLPAGRYSLACVVKPRARCNQFK